MVPEPALQPRGRRGRHRHADPLQSNHLAQDRKTANAVSDRAKTPKAGGLAPGRIDRPTGPRFLLPRSADARAEELGVADRRAALLALHRESGGDRGVAVGAAMSQLPTALRARRGQAVFVLEEVAQGVSADQAESDPVAERLPPLLLDPVPSCARHRPILPSAELAGELGPELVKTQPTRRPYPTASRLPDASGGQPHRSPVLPSGYSAPRSRPTREISYGRT